MERMEGEPRRLLQPLGRKEESGRKTRFADWRLVPTRLPERGRKVELPSFSFPRTSSDDLRSVDGLI